MKMKKIAYLKLLVKKVKSAISRLFVVSKEEVLNDTCNNIDMVDFSNDGVELNWLDEDELCYKSFDIL